MLSIGALASAAQGASYYERDGYYAKDDPEHRAASAWAGKGAEELGLKGPVDPETFKAILEGRVPDGSDTRLGRRVKDRGTPGSAEILHRPGRDLTFSAPKSVSIAALVGGDDGIVEAHDRAVTATLAWIEKNAAETRMKDRVTGQMARVGNQKIVAATFRHDTSRNLDPQLHSHAVLANMVQGEDGKWRSMANEGLYARQKLIGMLYRNELAGGLARLGYGIEKTHADGRFEIAGVSREAVEAFSTRRAEIEAAMAERNLGTSADNPRLAERAALMTRAAKRDIDRDELRDAWAKQAADLGFDARALAAEAKEKGAVPAMHGPESAQERGVSPETPVAASPEAVGLDGAANDRNAASEAVAWAMAHLSEREAVFARADLFGAALAHAPGTVTIAEAEREVAALEKAGTLHAVDLPGAEDSLATAKTVAEERETVASMRAGQGRGRAPMRGWQVQGHLNKGPLTAGQKDAVKLILSAEDRVVGVQGYAGSGKTTMLDRARVLAEKKGYRMAGLAPSASAVQTLASEAGIESETLQRFLARNAGVAEGRLARKGAKEMRAAFAKTILVVDEGSLASTVQARDLLRIANELRMPRVVLVGDAKQLDAVDAGKPFAQLQAAGMKTATMDEIMRQRDPALKEAVEASLKGEIFKAFAKLGSNVAEVKPDNISGAVAARWLRLGPEARENTGVMAPSHELRQEINGHIRERLAREGRIHGPVMESQRLVSWGYTNAEKALAGHYAVGDVVAFHRPYKRIGVGKGDERRVVGVNHKAREVVLEGRDGGTVAWKPGEIGGRRGRQRGLPDRRHRAPRRRPHPLDPQRCRAGAGEQPHRRGDVRRERAGGVPAGGRQAARAGPERPAAAPSRPRLGVHRARLPGPHRGQCGSRRWKRGTRISPRRRASMSRSAGRATGAELVTDDATELRAQLQAVTGERIAALEGIGEMQREAPRARRPGPRRPANCGRKAALERASATTGKAGRHPRRSPNRRFATAARAAWTLDCDGYGMSASTGRRAWPSCEGRSRT